MWDSTLINAAQNYDINFNVETLSQISYLMLSHFYFTVTRSGGSTQIPMQPNPSTSGCRPSQPLRSITAGDRASDPSPRGGTPEQPIYPSDSSIIGTQLVLPPGSPQSPEHVISEDPSDSSISDTQLVVPPASPHSPEYLIPEDPSDSSLSPGTQLVLPPGSPQSTEYLIPEDPSGSSTSSGTQLVLSSGSPQSPECIIPEQRIHPSDSSKNGTQLVLPSPSGSTLTPEKPIYPSDPPAGGPPPHKKRRNESQMLIDDLHKGIKASGSCLRKPRK